MKGAIGTEKKVATERSAGLAPVEGLRGAWLRDASGERYLNFAGLPAAPGAKNTAPAGAFLEEVRFKGRMLAGALEAVARRTPGAAEVRGEGLRLELDLGDAELARSVAEACEERGVLLCVSGDAVRLAPPVAVTRTEIRLALDALRSALRETLQSGTSGRTSAFPEPAVA